MLGADAASPPWLRRAALPAVKGLEEAEGAEADESPGLRGLGRLAGAKAPLLSANGTLPGLRPDLLGVGRLWPSLSEERKLLLDACLDPIRTEPTWGASATSGDGLRDWPGLCLLLESGVACTCGKRPLSPIPEIGGIGTDSCT
mmetsp:Transcript_27826/g.49750  ORF Transcript_27826/g.49750 Transcript_27826/m.49750 type:complete len:144 (+) Transcript_27826:1075-1506(+)